MRLLRYLLHDGLVQRLAENHRSALGLFVTRALAREEAQSFEREQALKLVRALALWDARGAKRTHLLSEGIVRTLVAIAHEPEDVLHSAVIETLAEWAMLDAPLLARTLAYAPLWRAVCEMPPQRSKALVRCLMGLLERPETRQFVCAGTDLAAVLAGFTNVPTTAQEHYEQRLQTTEQVTLCLLASWEGLLYLCMDDCAALRTIVSALHLNQPRIQSRILATLIALFLSTSPKKRPEDGHDARARPPPIPGPALREQYLGLVLVLLLDAGLMDALVGIVRASDELRLVASHLMRLVLNLARRVLPDTSAHLHAFPDLVRLACDGKSEPPESQLAAKTALLSIDRVESHLPFGSVDVMQHQQQYLSDVRTHLDATIDDQQFRALIRDSLVMATKEHIAWNVGALHELLDGPLLNARRFEEALTSTKLIRRLLSFYRPFSFRYSGLQASAKNEQWTALGRKYFRVLLLHPDGVRFLSEDRFLSEVREAFDQLVAHTPDPLFSGRHMHRTLVSGYFDFLQIFSESVSGLELLRHARIFTPLMALCSMDDHASLVVETLLQTLDYAHDAPTRLVLRRALTAGTAQVRLSATVRASHFLWLDGEPQEWAVDMLLSQLYDVAPQVRRLAVQLVQQASAHPAMLRCVMAQRPLIDLLSDEDESMLLRFLSQPSGFDHLAGESYVAQQAHIWYTRQNTAYVADAEHTLAHSLEADAPPLPIHLYAQLVATEAGCAYLAELGHVPTLAAQINDGCSTQDMLDCKAALWALVRCATHTGSYRHVGRRRRAPPRAQCDRSDPGACFERLGRVGACDLLLCLGPLGNGAPRRRRACPPWVACVARGSGCAVPPRRRQRFCSCTSMV